MKALAMEFNAVVHTATQSNDVELEQRNDPEFVLSRSNLNVQRIRYVQPIFLLLLIQR